MGFVKRQVRYRLTEKMSARALFCCCILLVFSFAPEVDGRRLNSTPTTGTASDVAATVAAVNAAATTSSAPVQEATRMKKHRCRDKSDIVMLIDGSWSIGPKNFNKIQNFLFGVVRAFSINATGGVHAALAQYSDDARTEFRLNEHVLKENVREAIDNIPYKGGNTATGRAINYAREVMFAVENGARPGASRKLILLTDGESILDDVEIPARKLR